jgi:large subunit ribosomal protein L28
MALRCDNCDKGSMYGHNVSHAKNRTARKFKPNLHSAKVEVNGMNKKYKLCTKCLRVIKKSKVQPKEVSQVAPVATA